MGIEEMELHDDMDLEPPRGRPRSRGNLEEMLNEDDEEELEPPRGRPRSRGNLEEMVNDFDDEIQQERDEQSNQATEEAISRHFTDPIETAAPPRCSVATVVSIDDAAAPRSDDKVGPPMPPNWGEALTRQNESEPLSKPNQKDGQSAQQKENREKKKQFKPMSMIPE